MLLRDDLIANGHTWENPRLERYLEALAGYIQDVDGAFANRGEPMPEPSWWLIALLLSTAKDYE